MGKKSKDKNRSIFLCTALFENDLWALLVYWMLVFVTSGRVEQGSELERARETVFYTNCL